MSVVEPMVRRIASGGAIWGVVCLLLAGCSGIEKLDSASGEVAHADLTARFPQQMKSGNPEPPLPRSEVYQGAPPDSADRAQVIEEGATDRGAEGFDLNFQNAEIGVVSKVLLGDLLKLTYSVDSRVQGTISLSSGRPVAKQHLMVLYESALKLVSANLVKEGGLYKVVPMGEALGSGSIDRDARQPGYGISVLPLRYVSAQVVMRAIDSFAAKPGAAKVDPARNLLLVQGSSTERASAIEAALALDVDWMRNQSVGIFPLRNASPDTIIAELQNVFDSGKEGTASQLVRFQPVNRLNAVLAVAQTKGMIEKARMWVERLDRSDTNNTAVRVYRLRYGNARVMAAILREVFTGQGGGLPTLGGTGNQDLSQLTPGSSLSRASSLGGSSMNDRSSGSSSLGSRSTLGGSSSSGGGGLGGSGDSSGIGGSGSGDPSQPGGSGRLGAGGTDIASLSTGGGAGGPGILPNVRITADIANNSLLIYASRDQYKTVERAIYELDRAPMQVAIDVTVAEVVLKNELQHGVQFYFQNQTNNAPKGSIGFGLTQILARTIPGGNLVLGSAADPRVVVNALSTITDVRVLSSPALVVLDNQQAMLQVGDEVPIATRSAQDVVVPNAPIVNNIEMRNTGVILRVTPRVNANGAVTLDVIQEVSAVANQADKSLTPTISQRRVQSSIAVVSGQTVLLGGLIQTKDDNTKLGLPILSDIKGIGNLFSTNTKTTTRTELIVFIRPQIIRNGIDAQLVAEELRSKLNVLGRGQSVPGPIPPRPFVATPSTQRR
jgi:general secretion pathway protein D